MTDDQFRLLNVMADPCSYPPGRTRDREAIAAALAEIERLEAERDKLIAGCIAETWRRTPSKPDDEVVWEWSYGSCGDSESTRADAVAAVREAAGLEDER